MIGRFINSVTSLATSETAIRAIDSLSQVVNAVASGNEGEKKVFELRERDLILMTKVATFKKCSLYLDKGQATFHTIYLSSRLSLFRSKIQSECEEIAATFDKMEILLAALEAGSSQCMVSQLEKLVDSVRLHPTYKEIHHASACGFADAIRWICFRQDAEVVVNTVSDDGLFPLHVAADNSHANVVQALIECGASLTKSDSNMRNVVHHAATRNHKILNVLKTSPQFEDAMDHPDEQGKTPLCLAIESGRFESVRLLLKAGCSTGPFPCGLLSFIVADSCSFPDSEKIIREIIKYSPDFLSETTNNGTTVLHKELPRKTICTIIDAGSSHVDVNIKDDEERTPLHHAILRRNLEQIVTLIALNADPNVADCNGNTALHLALENADIVSTKFLLCCDADFNVRNKNGLSPMDIAGKFKSRERREEVIYCLRIFTDPAKNQERTNVLTSFMQKRAMQSRAEMSASERKKLVNLVSFDGGGVRGIIVAQMLYHIEGRLGFSLFEKTGWLAGTSTGALLALYIAQGSSMKKCRNLYLRMKDDIFAGQRPYPEAGLENFLKDLFGECKTMADVIGKKLLILASSVATIPPELKRIRNYQLPLEEAYNAELGYEPATSHKIWLAARYSCSAPTYFPPRDNFMDGALMANNPVLELLTAVHQYNTACLQTNKEPEKISYVLSLGTGRLPKEQLEKFSANFSLPSSISQGVAMLKDLMTLKDLFVGQVTTSDGICVEQACAWCHDQSIPFFRLSPSLEFNVPLDETDNETIIDLLWTTEVYLRVSGKATVDSLVNFLKLFYLS